MKADRQHKEVSRHILSPKKIDIKKNHFTDNRAHAIMQGQFLSSLYGSGIQRKDEDMSIAENHEGLLPEKSDKGGLTYHHIIPKNRLANLWNSLREVEKTENDLALLRTSMRRIIIKANNQIYFPDGIDKEGVKGVVENAEGVSPSLNVMLQTVDMNLKKSENGNHENMELVGRVFQWMSSNIMLGPTNRWKKSQIGQLPNIETSQLDPEEEFEEGAKYILGDYYWEPLKEINENIKANAFFDYQATKKETLRNLEVRRNNLEADTSSNSANKKKTNELSIKVIANELDKIDKDVTSDLILSLMQLSQLPGAIWPFRNEEWECVKGKYVIKKT